MAAFTVASSPLLLTAPLDAQRVCFADSGTGHSTSSAHRCPLMSSQPDDVLVSFDAAAALPSNLQALALFCDQATPSTTCLSSPRFLILRPCCTALAPFPSQFLPSQPNLSSPGSFALSLFSPSFHDPLSLSLGTPPALYPNRKRVQAGLTCSIN